MANTAETRASKSFCSKLVDSIKSLNPETEAQRKQRGQEVLSLAHELLSLPHVVLREKEIEYHDDSTKVVYTTSTIYLKPEENKFGINAITFVTPTDIELCLTDCIGGDTTILDENSKTEKLSEKNTYIYMFYKGGSNVHTAQNESVNKNGFNKIRGEHDKYFHGPQQRKEFYETFVHLAKQLLAK